MSVSLVNLDAEVVGYSLYFEEDNKLFDLCGVKNQITHIQGDVRNLEHLKSVFSKYHPEIVIHMAAQPLVRKSYEAPVENSPSGMDVLNILLQDKN